MANNQVISSNTSFEELEALKIASGGPISATTIREEHLDPNGDGRISISEYYNADRNVPNAGEISYSDFYGTERVHTWYFGGNPEEASPVRVSITALEYGETYEIVELGDSDFTTVGAPQNTVGTVFECIGPGDGTGVAQTLPYKSGRFPAPDQFQTFTTSTGTQYRTYATSDYDLLVGAQSQGWNGFSELIIVIPLDIIIYNTSRTQPCVKIAKTYTNPNGGPAWVNSITLDNRGIILGKGGNGGGDNASGSTGSAAILIDAGRQFSNDPDSVLPEVAIFNQGSILGGGGGGGGSSSGSGGGGGGGAGGGAGSPFNGRAGGAGAGPIVGSEANNGNILRGTDGASNEPGRGGFAGGGGGGQRPRTKNPTLYGGGGGGGRDWRSSAVGGAGDNNGGGKGGDWNQVGSAGTQTGGGGGWGRSGGRSNSSSGLGGGAGQGVALNGAGVVVSIRNLGGGVILPGATGTV